MSQDFGFNDFNGINELDKDYERDPAMRDKLRVYHALHGEIRIKEKIKDKIRFEIRDNGDDKKSKIHTRQKWD